MRSLSRLTPAQLSVFEIQLRRLLLELLDRIRTFSAVGMETDPLVASIGVMLIAIDDSEFETFELFCSEIHSETPDWAEFTNVLNETLARIQTRIDIERGLKLQSQSDNQVIH